MTTCCHLAELYSYFRHRCASSVWWRFGSGAESGLQGCRPQTELVAVSLTLSMDARNTRCTGSWDCPRFATAQVEAESGVVPASRPLSFVSRRAKDLQHQRSHTALSFGRNCEHLCFGLWSPAILVAGRSTTNAPIVRRLMQPRPQWSCATTCLWSVSNLSTGRIGQRELTPQLQW